MKKYKIGFVILHYLAIEDTKLCVKSIIDRIDTDNYEIVIVDNHSYNNTGQKLKNLYKNNKKVKVILNKENLGFAKGNNIGFNYAKYTLKCDFICMLNNDAYLIQDNFFEIIKKEYKKSKFGVMGPEIHLLNNKIEVVNNKMYSKNEIENEIKKMKIRIIKNYLFIESIEIFLKKIIKEIIRYNSKYRNRVAPRTEDAVLHGCCLIFSPLYIKFFDGLDEKTFLYCEEEFLYLKLKNSNMPSIYNPELKIFHSEDKATLYETKKNYKKRRFSYKWGLIALKKLNDEIKE